MYKNRIFHSWLRVGCPMNISDRFIHLSESDTSPYWVATGGRLQIKKIEEWRIRVSRILRS
jgi:hypothetical protein